MKAWEEEEKNPIQNPLLSFQLWVPKQEMREHGAKGGGESSSIKGYIFRLLLILFCVN